MLNDGEEIRSPKRKVIRVEPEETQDYVINAKSTEYEEEEERTFAPNAVSVPQRNFDNWPTRKGRREYKVSGSRNRQPQNTLSK